MLFVISISILMGISFIGMLICAKKQHDNSAARPLALVFMLIVVVCGILMLTQHFSPPDAERLKQERLTFIKSSAYVLAKHLGAEMPGIQVLVFVNNKIENEPKQKALKKGLKEGFSPNVTDIIYLTPKVTIPQPKDGKVSKIMDIAKAKDINNLLRRYPKCKLVISMIGLPKDQKDLNIVKDFQRNSEKATKLAFIDCPVTYYKPWFESGLVAAGVVPDLRKKYSQDSPSSDLEKSFGMRYLLITPKNVDEISQTFGRRIFSKPKENNKENNQ